MGGSGSTNKPAEDTRRLDEERRRQQDEYFRKVDQFFRQRQQTWQRQQDEAVNRVSNNYYGDAELRQRQVEDDRRQRQEEETRRARIKAVRRFMDGVLPDKPPSDK